VCKAMSSAPEAGLTGCTHLLQRSGTGYGPSPQHPRCPEPPEPCSPGNLQAQEIMRPASHGQGTGMRHAWVSVVVRKGGAPSMYQGSWCSAGGGGRPACSRRPAGCPRPRRQRSATLQTVRPAASAAAPAPDTPGGRGTGSLEHPPQTQGVTLAQPQRPTAERCHAWRFLRTSVPAGWGYSLTREQLNVQTVQLTSRLRIRTAPLQSHTSATTSFRKCKLKLQRASSFHLLGWLNYRRE
jgi:hypothetical protein